MDIFFADPTEIPLPPDEVRIRELKAEPWPDGRRVRVTLELDPFQVRPNADLVIRDEHGEEIAHANIIESMDRMIEATLHLRGDLSSQSYRLDATLYYANIDETPEAGSTIEPIERQIVDQAHTSFELPKA
jgi:hypothetical protein